MNDKIIYSDSAGFGKDVLQSELPVLVDFYADWCPPCQMIAPSLEMLADEYQGKARIVKVNIDENPELSAAYAVRNIPTLMTFKNGEIAHRSAGAMPKSQLADLINQVL